MVALFIVILILFSAVIGALPEKVEGCYLPECIIVGGENANIADYPYQLSLNHKYLGPFCGATLISPDWALTAARCTLNTAASDLRVRAGSSFSNSGGQLINVKTIFQHKDFNYITGENDISLLKLDANVTVANAQEIALATNKPEANEIATLTGWDITGGNVLGLSSEELQVAEVSVVDDAQCQSVNLDIGVDFVSFCTGPLVSGGQDGCALQSGGPVIVDGVLAGIQSWGTRCIPSVINVRVSTNVARYSDWLDELVSPEE